MPSGYENSPDYGGPEPRLWLSLIGLAVPAFNAVGYRMLG
jgi:hypothetical protein